MHQLEQRRHVLVGFGCELPAVLLDSFGGAEEADDGPFTFGSLVRGSLCGLAAASVRNASAAGTDDDAGQR